MSSKIFFSVLFLAMISSSHQASELITQSCQKTLYKDLCTSTLGSASVQDLQSLTKFALNTALSNGDEIQKVTLELIKKGSDESVKQYLTDCSELYQGAIDQLKKSVGAVDAKSYNDVNAWVTAAQTDSGSCEDGFKEKPGSKSPLTDANTKFSQLCSIILTFSNLLAKNN